MVSILTFHKATLSQNFTAMYHNTVKSKFNEPSHAPAPPLTVGRSVIYLKDGKLLSRFIQAAPTGLH
jgi:hypothetical protein